MKNSKNICIRYLILIAIILNFGCNHETSVSNGPKIDGLVPDQETAIKIAEAVWLARFGEMVLDEKPYVAKLDGSIWKVQGTLHHAHGGNAFIELQSSDGKILGVWHTK